MYVCMYVCTCMYVCLYVCVSIHILYCWSCAYVGIYSMYLRMSYIGTHVRRWWPTVHVYRR